MQPFRIAFVLALAALAVRADDLSFKVDSTKVSEFQGKAFNLKDAPGFGGTAAGFDKEFKGSGTGAASGWADRRADMGGRDVYTPDLKMEKAFAVPQTTLFQGASSFSGQTAPFSMATKLPQDAPLDAPIGKFGAAPFADKAYTGPENDRLRQAMAQLLDKGQDQASGTPDPLRPSAKSEGIRQQLNSQGGKIAPIITVDDVKGLLNKDVAPVSFNAPDAVPAPASAGTFPAAAGKVAAQGVTVK